MAMSDPISIQFNLQSPIFMDQDSDFKFSAQLIPSDDTTGKKGMRFQFSDNAESKDDIQYPIVSEPTEVTLLFTA